MRKWVRNVTGRCAPPRPPRTQCRQRPLVPALESESSAVVVPLHYRWAVTRGSRGMCFPVTLWEEKLSFLSNRVWLGCDDAVNVLGEPDREEAAVALGGGLTFLITEPRRERRAGEEVGFCPASWFFVFCFFYRLREQRFCVGV